MGAGSSRYSLEDRELLKRLNVKSRINEELRALGPAATIGSERNRIIEGVLELARSNPNVRTNAARNANERAILMSRPNVKRRIAQALKAAGPLATVASERNEIIESVLELARKNPNIRYKDDKNANELASKAARNASERAQLLSRKNVKRRIAQALEAAGALATVGSERNEIIESVLELARKNPNIRYNADKDANRRAEILSMPNVSEELSRRYASEGWGATVGSKKKEIEESVIRNFMNGKILPVKGKSLEEHYGTALGPNTGEDYTEDMDALAAAASLLAEKMPAGLSLNQQKQWISTELDNALSSGYFSLVNALPKKTRKALQKYKSGIFRGMTKKDRKTAANRAAKKLLNTPLSVASPVLGTINEGDEAAAADANAAERGAVAAQLAAAEEEERRLMKELETQQRLNRVRRASETPLYRCHRLHISTCQMLEKD